MQSTGIVNNGRTNNDFGPKCKTGIVNNAFSAKTGITYNAQNTKNWNNP